jgi:hypothetical protein
MVFETVYLLRQAVKRATQDVVYIPTKSFRAVVAKLLEEDNIAIYPVNNLSNLDEDLREMQKSSLLVVENDRVVINRKVFLDATKFVERQEELLRDDRYASAIFAKLKQRARQIQVQS